MSPDTAASKEFLLRRTPFAVLLASLALPLCFASVVLADNVVIPHAFSSATPARASEVNANFLAVKGWGDNMSALLPAAKFVAVASKSVAASSSSTLKVIPFKVPGPGQVILSFYGTGETKSGCTSWGLRMYLDIDNTALNLPVARVSPLGSYMGFHLTPVSWSSSVPITTPGDHEFEISVSNDCPVGPSGAISLYDMGATLLYVPNTLE